MTIGYVWFGAAIGAAFTVGVIVGCFGCASWAMRAMTEDPEG